MTTSSTMQGIDAIRYLSANGWPGFGLPWYGKDGYKAKWNAYGKGADECAAISHYNAGKIVTVLTDGQHVVLDRDFHWSESLCNLGSLAHTAKIQRSNAPDRGALLYEVIDAGITSQNYKPDGSKEPHAEMIALASTGNHKAKAIAGIHNGGVYQLVDTHYGIKRVTRAELDTIWYILTGTHLDERRKRTERPQETHRAPADGDGVIQQVKAYWSAYSVFERFGLASEPERQRDGYKLHGNGGLYVGNPDDADKRHQWFCHSDDAGGDQIHAWHYCRHGRIFDAGDRVAFRETLLEMATAAGIEIPAYSPTSAGVVDPDEVRAEVAQLRAWVKSTSFADLVPTELQSAVGYRTDANDTRIADAYLDIAAERGTWRFRVSNRTIAEKAGVSAGSITAARRRLADWFLVFHEDGMIGVSDVARRLIIVSSDKEQNRTMINLRATYSERKGDDVFMSGTSRTKRDEAEAEAERRGVKAVGQVIHFETRRVIVDDLPVVDGSIVGNPFTDEQMVAFGYDKRILPPYRVVLREYMAGLGENVLRIIDALEIHGDMTRAEMVDATGKSAGAIGRATRTAESLGLISSEQEHAKAPKLYSLNPDWADSVEMVRPHMKTHRLGLERRKSNLEALRKFLNAKLDDKNLEDDERRQFEKRLARTQTHYAEVIAQMHEGVDIDRWVVTPNGKQAQLPHSMDRAHSDWMMEITQVQRRQERQNLAQIDADLRGGYEHLAHYAMAAD